MNSANALDNTFEQTRNERLYLLYFANFEDFLELGQEKSFLNAISEGPVLEKAFQERDCQGAVFSEEKHRTTEELFIELGAGLNFMERDDDVLKENNVLVTEGYSESRND
jgi:hypothetical protein